MSLVSLVVFALVGGYAFATIWTPSVYHAAREFGHRLYLRVVFYTVFLLLVSLCLHIILFVNCGIYLEFIKFIDTFIESNIGHQFIFSKSSKISILIFSFILGPLLGHLLNFPKWSFLINLHLPIIKTRPFFLCEQVLLENAIKNNDFEKLIARSVYDSFPILFTLVSGKVYVGWAVSAPNPVQERKFIRILPIISGYRDKDTQTVKFTTDYYPILSSIDNGNNQGLSTEDFEVVIPSSQLSSCHLFDMTVYNEHFQPPSSP
jgi:hypothetical protein